MTPVATGSGERCKSCKTNDRGRGGARGDAGPPVTAAGNGTETRRFLGIKEFSRLLEEVEKKEEPAAGQAPRIHPIFLFLLIWAVDGWTVIILLNGRAVD